jgi:hypothetical protein
MAEVFISYSQKDRTVAQGLADQLTANGVSVWWDTELVGGEVFREAIEEQLQAAEVVIVLWSPNAVASKFVVDEADVAAATGKLVSVLLDGFDAKQTPIGFRSYQAVSINDGQGIERALRRRGLSFASFAPSTPAAAAPRSASVVEVPRRSQGRTHHSPVDRLDEATREEEAWKFVLSKQENKLVADFLREFPNSKYFEEAKGREKHINTRILSGWIMLASMASGVALGIYVGIIQPGVGLTGAFIGLFFGLIFGFLVGAILSTVLSTIRSLGGAGPYRFLRQQEERFLKGK